MIKLIENELLKLHARRGSYYFAIFLFVLSILTLIVSTNILSNINSMYRFASLTIRELLSFIILYAAVEGSKSVSDEYQKGTIKQLLIRPRKRITLLFSKYITLIIAIIMMVILASILSLLFGFIGYGIEYSSNFTLLLFVKYVIYEIPRLLFYATLTFFLGTVFRSAVLPIVIGLFFIFTEGITMAILNNYTWAKYIVTYHLHLRVYDPNPLLNGGLQPPFPEFTIGLSLLLITAYIALLLGIAANIFARRDIL